jgi:hypothetical protein
MTKNILQSDIDLAKQLLGGDHSESDVVEVLVRRGIEPTSAAQLVSDLRQGKQAAPTLQFGKNGPLTPPKEPQAESASPVDAESAESESDHRRVRTKRRRGSGSNRRKTSERRWGIIAALVCIFGLAAGTVLYQFKYHHRTQFLLDQLEAAIQMHERELVQAQAGAFPGQTPKPMSKAKIEDFRRHSTALRDRVAARKLTDNEQAALGVLVKRAEGLLPPPPEGEVAPDPAPVEPPAKSEP